MAGLFRDADQSWQKHDHLYVRWTWITYVFGILGPVLAALAGFGGLTSLFGKTAAGLIAVASAAASGIALSLNGQERHLHHRKFATAWDNLRDDITIAYETRPPVPTVNKEPTDMEPVGWQAVLDKLRSRAFTLRSYKLDDGVEPRWPPAH